MPICSLRYQFNIDHAKLFVNDIQFQRSSYYYFLGGIVPWNGVGGNFVGDIRPDIPTIDSYASNRDARSEIVFVKKILPADVSLVTRKIPWEPEKIFDQYDHTKDLKYADFYCINNENRVYKCLYNNEGSKSTIEPSFIDHEPVKLVDGYIWKYMYRVSPFKMDRFRSVDWMPVQRSMSDNFYNNGMINDVVVINSGDGYQDDINQTTILVNDDGVTTGAGATGTLVVENGTIIDITITNSGSEYTKGAKIEIDDVGVNAIIEPIIVDGEIVDVMIINGGFGYTQGSSVTFPVGGAKLLPVISRVTSSIIDVIILDAGIGYTTNPVVDVFSVGDVGTGLYGNPTALFESVVYDGKIQHINTIDPGTNYPVDTDTSISVNGDGTGAVFTPIIYDNQIVDVVVENPGTGYTEIILTVQSSSGTGAVLSGIITQNDYESDQSVIEQLSNKGIYAAKMVDNGMNYTPQTYITVNGNGTGATAVPVIEGGSIVSINITNNGENYTWADISIVDPGRIVVPQEEQAGAYAIISPYYGHGYDAPQELFADTVAVVSPVRSELEAFDITQDFRSFGIIKNPSNIISGTRYLAQNSLIAYRMNFNTTNNLVVDEVLHLDTNRYRVLSINGNNEVYLIALDNQRIEPVGTLTSGEKSYEVFRPTPQFLPSFDKYSGDMITLSLENPFTFSQEQNLSIKTFIKF